MLLLFSCQYKNSSRVFLNCGKSDIFANLFRILPFLHSLVVFSAQKHIDSVKSISEYTTKYIIKASINNEL